MYYTVKVYTEKHEVYIWHHVSGANSASAARQAVYGVRVGGNDAEITKVETREEGDME